MNDLAAEGKRLNESLWRMLWKGGTSAEEIPIRIHDHGTDAGHGLGGPPLHPKFIAYLKSAGACFCDEFDVDGNPRPHVCDRRFEETGARFRESQKQSHPHRLKRALRQVKLVAPYDQYHLVYLMVSRGRTMDEAAEQINTVRVTRGGEPYSTQDIVIMMIAGFDLLSAAW
jgi:hypothetical protein